MNKERIFEYLFILFLIYIVSSLVFGLDLLLKGGCENCKGDFLGIYLTLLMVWGIVEFGGKRKED